jgi:membrane protein required for colicin V production
MGGVLTELAPKGLDLAGRVEPAFARAVHGGSGDRNAAEGYDARDSERDDLQVERSR